MRFLALALLLASPVFGQIEFSDLTIADTSITSTAVSPAPDWAGSFVAVWTFDGTNPDEWDNESATSCGSNCDGSASGSPVRDTTTYIEGVASLESDYTTPDYVSTSGDEISVDLNDSSITWGAWFLTDTDDASNIVGRLLSNVGYQMDYGDGADLTRCKIGGGVDTTTHTGDNDEIDFDESWYHLACYYDHTNYPTSSEIDNWVNGVDSTKAATTTHTDGMTGTNRSPRIGRDALGTGYMNVDEAFVYSGLLDDPDVCRLCSCGIKGAECTYSGTSWVDEGRNASRCNSCTLCADASAANPGACS